MLFAEIKEFTATFVNYGRAPNSLYRDHFASLDSKPMPRLRFAVSARCASALVLAGLLTCAQAAELGEAIVRSHIGQPLIADIELTHLADPSVAVVVRLAHPDVYKGANIAMHPVLSNLNMSVMRRDGRQFLHVTSTRQVDSQYVHLFLELIEGGKRNIRAETLWLTPDPAPAPPPAPAPAPLGAKPEAAAPAPAPSAAALPAPLAARPALPKPEAPAARVLKLPPAASAAATCPSAEQVKACAETDYKNGLLSAQIVELEEKVKALELAMKGSGVAAPDVTRAAAAKAAKTPPPPPPKAVPKKKEEGFPWLLVAAIAAGLAILGAAVFYFLRRRKAGAAATAEDVAADSAAWYARLAGRLRRKPKDPAPVEPELPK